MEVEVKLRLPSREAHQQVVDTLAPFHAVTHLQENLFFDGGEGELSSQKYILCLRFYNGDTRCVASLKGKAAIKDGISTVTEEEEDLDPGIGPTCVGEPWCLASLNSPLLKKTIFQFGCHTFVCLGGFRNVRNVYHWEGETIELDETHYEFGYTYEIECETNEPERVRTLLEGFLSDKGISFSYSTVSKFAVFRSGKPPITAV